MPALSDFALASCQATVFTPEEEVSPAKLVSGLLPAWAKRFDGEPVVLPFPGPVPREVPRIILQNRTGSWRCEIASSRINLFWRRTSDQDVPPSLEAFFQEAADWIAQYQVFQRSRIGRLAAVLNRVLKLDSPALYLAKHFCQERWLTTPLNRPEAFELHAHKRYDLAGFGVNSWVRNKTAELGLPGGQPNQPIIVVEQDLNTFPEREAATSYSADEARSFFQIVVPEFDHILKLYYPSEGAA